MPYESPAVGGGGVDADGGKIAKPVKAGASGERTKPVMSFTLSQEVADRLRQWPDGMRSLLADAMFREKLGLPPSDRMAAIAAIGRRK